MWKSALVGALVALVLAIVVVSAGVVYLRQTHGDAGFSSSDPVVLVFESSTAETGTVASLVTVVADGRLLDVSPNTTVTIAGTSSTRLADALVFGGGELLVSAIPGDVAHGAKSFVAVPDSAWRHCVDAVGGVRVTLPSDVTAFDGNELIALRSGEQTLTSAEVGAVLQAMPFLTAEARDPLRESLERQMARALVRGGQSLQGIDSDLSSDQIQVWLRDGLSRATVAAN